MRAGLALWGEANRRAKPLALLALVFFLSAQAPPAAPADSLRTTTVRTVVALLPDTTRRAAAVAPTALAPDAPDRVTRRLAFRIAGAIVLLSLSTLLLYNVRSR